MQTEVLLGQRPKTATHNTPDGTIYGAALSRVHPLSTFAFCAAICTAWPSVKELICTTCSS